MTEEKIHRLPGLSATLSKAAARTGAGSPKVNLADMLLILESQNDCSRGFVDGMTGAIHLITEDVEFSINEPDESIPDWLLPDVRVARAIENGEGNYLPMPTRNDINEFDVMTSFTQQEMNPTVNDRLRAALGGRGTFRRFREVVRECGLTDAWESYRVREIERVAVDWCDAHGLGYDPAELTWLNSAQPAQEPAQHLAFAENERRLFNEPVFTHVTWRAKAGHEREFIDAWNKLGDLFPTLEHPPIEVTLIRSANDPALFHSIGSWRSLADAQSVGDNASAIDAIATITELCDEGMPAVYEVVRTVRPE